jgi:hypothetical protein
VSQKVFGRAVQSESSSGQTAEKQTGIMTREISLGVKNTDVPFVYRNFGRTWHICFLG